MYTQRIIHIAALGKNADLRRALEERNATANAAGSPHALQMRLFSPEPALIHSIRFENLAAIEVYQDKNAGDSNVAAQTAKISQFLARPQTSELYQTLVPAQVSGTPKFSLRNKRCPALGKGPELRRLLEEVARRSVPGRIGASLAAEFVTPDGPAFVTTSLFASLAGMDQYRAANTEDASFRALLSQVNALLARPAQQEILRILVPFPA